MAANKQIVVNKKQCQSGWGNKYLSFFKQD